MEDLFFWISFLFVLLSPFLLMEALSLFFYKISFLKVISWWRDNRSHADTSVLPPCLLGMLFIMFILWTCVGAMVGVIEQAVAKKSHTVAYIGNSNEMKSHFIIHLDTSDEHVFEYDGAKGYNYSFRSIYTKSVFEEERGSEFTGKITSGFSLFGALLTLLWFLTSLVFLLGIVNALVHPVLVALNAVDKNKYITVDDDISAAQLLDQVTKKYGGSTGRFFILGFVLLLLSIVSIFFMPSSASNGARLKVLPAEYRAGAEVQGIPIKNLQRPETYYYDDGTRADMWDAVFTFKRGFNTPVFVALKYDRNKEKEAFEKIERFVKNKKNMPLILLDDLTLKIKTP